MREIVEGARADALGQQSADAVAEQSADALADRGEGTAAR
jgi:hypothetical protein